MFEIAVVGIGCRFPGNISNAGEFWDFLMHKGDGICEVPADRWSLERYYDADPDAPGRMYTRRGGFLQQSLYDFDPEYFGISPREASIMDPQQRLILEVSVEALDDAGIGARVGGRDVGVYVGGFTSDNMVMRHSHRSRSVINSHTATSGTFTMLSNRLSYVLDLRGPSMTIDTACSSSLVAIHEAAQAVARGECEVAIAGGVNAMMQPETFVSMCKGRFLAADGRCKTFDAAADGYARGEGAGAIVLKPLAQARADRDRVYAVIRATGANQDGHTSGITVPNPDSQAALARRVLGESGLAAHEIGYVEAHGTGTSIGDPLEMQALGQIYGAVPGRQTPLIVGSVKNSIGHTEAAAGVAGVIKAALTVHHRAIAPQAWLQQLNPAIPFADYRVDIPTEPREFPAEYEHVGVAVNGFGYGGTNAHVVMCAAEPVPGVERTDAPAIRVFPVSGRTDGAVRATAGALAEQLAGAPEDELHAAQSAAWARRIHHPVRAGVPWTTREDLVEQLQACADGNGPAPARVVSTDPVAPVFVFSGMGPQWWRMGRDLLQRDGVFADRASEIDAQFRDIAGWSIIDELLADESESQVTNTAIAQPANFLLQVALTAELEALGVVPAAIVGHSVGEVSAAYVSGALSLPDALLVSYHRARLQASTAGSGGMLAVGLPAAEVADWLAGDVCVAAVNSSSSVTLAGDSAALKTLAEDLSAEGVFARALKVEVPYHSQLMDPILSEIETVLAGVTPRVPTVPLYSSVTAAPVAGAEWGATYWVDNVRQPVRFADTVQTLLADGHRVFLEVGPHPVLGGNIRELLVRGEHPGAVVSTLSRDQDDDTSLRHSVADLYAAGALDPHHEPGAARAAVPQVTLPAYPWQRSRLWSEVESIHRDRLGSDDHFPMLGERTTAGVPEWEVELASAALPWLPDHVVDDLVVLPGAAYLDAALSAAATLHKRETQALADVRFLAPRIVDPHDVPVLRLSVQTDTGRFCVDSRSADEDGGWTRNVRGRIVDGAFLPGRHDFTIPTDSVRVKGDQLYDELAARGLRYGPAFRGIVEAWVSPDQVIATVDASGTSNSSHLAHPSTLDAALQCVAALVANSSDAMSGPVVPYAVRSVRRYHPFPECVRVAVERLDRPGLHADITLADEDGTVLFELLGVEFRPVRPVASWRSELEPRWYELVWEQIGTPPEAPTAAALESGRLVVVATDAESAMASGLRDAHPRAELVVLRGGADALLAPGAGFEVETAVRRASEDGAPVTIAYVPGPAEPTSVDVVAGLLAVASAVQHIHDAQVLDAGSATSPADAAGDAHTTVVRGVVVTEQAFGLPGDPGTVQLAHAGLIGLRRTLRNEQPALAWRHVDVEADTPIGQLAAAVLIADDPVDVADEVALRGGLRLVTTLQRNLAEHLAAQDLDAPMTDPQRSFRVEAPASMLMSDLCLREIERVAPGPEQVEVRVLSAGLNYKDAAKVLGLLTERELAGTYFGTSLGMEAIGVVTRVGPGENPFRVGDRLSIGMRDSLCRYLTIDVDRGGGVSLAPTPWSDTDSALNLPFLTAHHALVDTVRVQPGETVLVHGAAGGVGLAAVQVAKRLGATVIGTAGNPERRAAVLAAGADAVLDSRSLNFVDDVRAASEGRGADVVLNSAPGEFVAANLDVAAEFGRIVEIGKADIYGGAVLPLAPFDRNLSFFAIDIDRMIAMRRPAARTLIDTVNALFESGDYRPLPTTVYPLARLHEAFEAVARGSNIGRVVLDFGDDAPPVRRPVPRLRVRHDATYLITGGFGAFGLATARWLAAHGAAHLVLAGRRGAVGAALEAVESLRTAGVQIEEAVLDVSDPVAVDTLITRLSAGPAPLAGVFHAAGVLDDRAFTEIDAASLRAVFAPKAVGGWNLHRACVAAGVELDYFVVYSSASAITGTVPQSSYAAANTVLDSLVQIRRAAGQHAVAVNWGALSGGMAASSDDVARHLAMIGLAAVDIDLAPKLLGHVLELDATQVGILDVDWSRWGATHPTSAGTTRFAPHVSTAGAAGSDAARMQAELLALPEEQRVEVVAYMLAEQVATVLGVPSESVDPDVSLPDLGLDSLMAVELQARVNLAMDVEVSALEFSRGGGLRGLSARILPLFGAPADAATPVAAQR